MENYFLYLQVFKPKGIGGKKINITSDFVVCLLVIPAEEADFSLTFYFRERRTTR